MKYRAMSHRYSVYFLTMACYSWMVPVWVIIRLRLQEHRRAFRGQNMRNGRENIGKAWFAARTVLCLGKIPTHWKLRCVDPFLANRFYKKKIKRLSLRVCARMCVRAFVLILRIVTITDIEKPLYWLILTWTVVNFCPFYPQVLQQWCQRAEDIFNSEHLIWAIICACTLNEWVHV